MWDVSGRCLLPCLLVCLSACLLLPCPNMCDASPMCGRRLSPPIPHREESAPPSARLTVWLPFPALPAPPLCTSPLQSYLLARALLGEDSRHARTHAHGRPSRVPCPRSLSLSLSVSLPIIPPPAPPRGRDRTHLRWRRARLSVCSLCRPRTTDASVGVQLRPARCGGVRRLCVCVGGGAWCVTTAADRRVLYVGTRVLCSLDTAQHSTLHVVEYGVVTRGVKSKKCGWSLLSGMVPRPPSCACLPACLPPLPLLAWDRHRFCKGQKAAGQAWRVLSTQAEAERVGGGGEGAEQRSGTRQEGSRCGRAPLACHALVSLPPLPLSPPSPHTSRRSGMGLLLRPNSSPPRDPQTGRLPLTSSQARPRSCCPRRPHSRAGAAAHAFPRAWLSVHAHTVCRCRTVPCGAEAPGSKVKNGGGGRFKVVRILLSFLYKIS